MSITTREQTKLSGHRWLISCLEFSPGGLHLASGGWDKVVRIWDLTSLESTFTLSHTTPVTSVAWCPGGTSDTHLGLLASGTTDGIVSLWNGTSGGLVRKLSDGHKTWVLGTSFSSDGSVLATSSWDKLVRLWNIPTGDLLANLVGHTSGVWTCAFHPEKSSTLLCSGAADGSLKLWDMRTRGAVLSLVGGHDDSVKCCGWSPDGGYIASGSADNKIAIWEPRSGLVLNKIRGHEDAVSSVQFYPFLSNKSVPLLFSVGDCTCRIWHPLRKRNKQLLSLRQHKPGHEVEALSVSPDGTLMATGGHDMQIVLSSLDVSLSQVDALPLDEPGDDSVNYGAMLWQKYTRKVIEKSQNGEISSHKPETVPVDLLHNTSSVVGEAIHKTEQKTKLQKAEKGMSPETSREHEAREKLLRQQRAKLRQSGRNTMQSNKEHLPSELEAVRQHLRHVELEEHKDHGDISNRVLDYTNNNAPGLYSMNNHVKDANSRKVDEKTAYNTLGIINGNGQDYNIYNCPMPAQNSGEKDGSDFHDYSEIQESQRGNGYTSRADSSSISSSNYYADIEEVTKEMFDLADDQMVFDEKF